MQIGLQIGTEFLDLAQDTKLDLELQNIFLQFDEDLVGGYSLPFQVLNTSKNLRLLQFAGLIEKRIDNSGIDAIAWDGGIQHSVGKIKIEKSNINMNKTREGNISCYYLTGASSFWQDVKDKKMRDIDTGGNRIFAWDDYALTGAGFCSHINSVISAPAGYGTSGYDYGLFPVVNIDIAHINPLFNDEFSAFIMNDFDDADGAVIDGRLTWFDFVPSRENKNIMYISPFHYLRYVLDKALEFVGWTIKGDILTDPDFLKIAMINFRCIDWGMIVSDGTIDAVKPHTQVSFNLSDHLPDISISEFLIALKNRFGWWYEFDQAAKQITIHHLKDIVDQPAKDFTKYASPLVIKTISQDQTVYALRNDFLTNLKDGAPQFDNIKLVGYVLGSADLPPATEALYGQVYLVVKENNFYICRFINDDTLAVGWEMYTYNIYDVVPEGANKDVTTKATCVGEEFDFTMANYCARIDNPVVWFGSKLDKSDWGIHLSFFQGVQPQFNNDLQLTSGSGLYNPYTADKLSNWSIAFQCKDADGNEVGLYDLQWKPFLDLLKSNESIEVILYLPFTEYINLKFLDQIVVRNTRMFISKIKASVPYDGSVTLECTRI